MPELKPDERELLGRYPLKFVDRGSTPPSVLYAVEGRRRWLIHWDGSLQPILAREPRWAVWDDASRTVSRHESRRQAHLAAAQLEEAGRPKVVANLWVCVDCMLAHANGEIDPDRRADEPEVWALWANEPGHATMGLLREEHADGCSPDDECDCEERSFSTSSCDGCGSALHGTRHAFSWWSA